MTFEAGFDSVLPQILPGYLNKLLKVRSKMGYRHLQRGGGRTGIWKKLTCRQFTFLVIKLGEAPKYQSWKDPTSQIQFLLLLTGIKKHLPPHRSIWTVSVQREWRRGSSQLHHCAKLFWKLCVQGECIHVTVAGEFIRMHLVHTQSAWYSPNIIPR